MKKLYVIFDFPLDLNTERKYFYRKLKDIGFKRIQYSVWVGGTEKLSLIKEMIEGLIYKEYVKIIIGEVIE